MHRKITWGFHYNYIWFMYKYVVIHHNHVIQIGKKFTDVSSDIPTFTSQYSVYIKHGV